MAQGDHLKFQRGAATNAKREERDDSGRKVIIGRCATTTLPKICDICGIYGFLSRHRDGQPRSFTPGINWQGAAPPRDSLHERKVIAFGAGPAIVCAERTENGGSAGSIGDPPTAPWRGRFTLNRRSDRRDSATAATCQTEVNRRVCIQSRHATA
jgi:hypothetical protein